MSQTDIHPDRDARAGDDRLDDLLRRLVDGVITADEHAELASRLSGDETARRRYRDYMTLHALLHWDQAGVALRPIALEPPRAIEVRAGDMALAPSDRPDRAPHAPVVARLNAWQRGAIAAAVAIGVGLAIALMSGGPSATSRHGATPADRQAGPGIAMLTDSSGATWAADSVVHEASAAGEAVPDGPIILRSGSAQMVLASGAAVTLQGPTELRVTGPNRTMFTRGRLTVNVPPHAHGMTVDAPGGVSVVDLGTRFSMAVDEWGRVEVYVIEGEVEVTAAHEGKRAKTLRLAAGRAMWLIEDRVSPIAITNVALGKPAQQSSSYALNRYTADAAVDGNLTSISHTRGGYEQPKGTEPDRSPRWQVDLGKLHTVRSIVLHNRHGCCGARLRDITVEVLAEDGQTVVYRSELLNPENVLKSPDKLAVVTVDDLGGAVHGRYVRVSRTGDADLSGNPKPGATDSGHAHDDAFVLSLGEVEVFGYAVQARP